MKRMTSLFLALLFVVTLSHFATAAVITHTITPDFPGAGGSDIQGVPGIFPSPEFQGGSWQAQGNAVKSQIYFTPEYLFGRDNVTLNDIAAFRYATLKATLHTVDAPDWYIHFYTKPFDGSPGSGWYGYRINSEPYFAANLTETPGDWNQWRTGDSDATNSLRFFDSSNGYFGSYTDPLWDEFRETETAEGRRYGTEEILYISLATGSGWAEGFTGYLDGLSFAVADESGFGIDTVNVNFEPAAAPIPEPSTFILLFAGLGGLVLFRRLRTS